MAGCGNFSNINSIAEAGNNVIGVTSGQSAETTDWEPTTFETVNNIDGVTMAVKEGTASPTGLTVILENKTDRQCIYSESFSLEKKINESWYQVPVVIDGNYGFEDIGYILASKGDSEWTVDWKWLYGSLGSGEYRIIKDVLVSTDLGEYETHYLAAEFVID